MNKLDYGTFDPTNADIAFASTNGYTDPASELETRKQLSYPLKELKTYINNTVTEDSLGNAIQLVATANSLKYRSSAGGALTDITLGIPSGGTTGQILQKNSSTNYDTEWADKTLDVLTTAPASANTDGVKVVYLASEPATKYDGYIYLIKE